MRTAKTQARVSGPAIFNAVGNVVALEDGSMTMAGCDDDPKSEGAKRLVLVPNG